MDHPRSLGCTGISLSMARFVIIEKWTLIRIPSLFPFAHWPRKEDLNRTTTEWRRWVGGWMDDKTHDQWYRPAWAGQIFTWNKAGEATQQGQARAPTRKFKQKQRKRVLVMDGLLSLCVFSVVRLVLQGEATGLQSDRQDNLPVDILDKIKICNSIQGRRSARHLKDVSGTDTETDKPTDSGLNGWRAELLLGKNNQSSCLY